MAYSTVPTVATGDLWTAANHNTYIRDNFAAGVPDLFTTKGDSAWATAADTAARMGVGANKQLVYADSAATPGVAWKHGDPYAYFSVSKSADQTPSGATLVTWNTERHDPDGVFGSDKFTAPVAGLYFLHAKLWTWANVGDTVSAHSISLKKNGSATGGLGETLTTYFESTIYNSIDRPYPSEISLIALLAAGDYVEVYFALVAGTDANWRIGGGQRSAVVGDRSWFMGYLIR